MISKAKKKYIQAFGQKKHRREEHAFVAEGPKIVRDLMAVTKPLMVVATAGWIDANNAALPPSTEVIAVTDDELRNISFLQHPQQVLAVFSQDFLATEAGLSPEGLYIALDGVQDPGNLGTIIRIADWFGVSRIFCSPETADVWNPKVIQATMGSIARVSIEYTPLDTLIDSLPDGFPVYGTLLDGDDITSADTHNHGIIIMGNEGNGISPRIRERVTHKLLIPNYPKGSPTADSLNVAIATAITCFAIRQRT
ncbi:MAG: TrmH family RNA methyltransferase [Prevotella sp.]